MIASNHVLAGTIIGEYINDPYLAFGAGLASHLILDTIPHFDSVKYILKGWRYTAVIAVDFVLLGILIFYFSSRLPLHLSVFTAVLGGLLPDLIDNIPVLRNKVRRTRWGAWLHYWHDKIHFYLPKKYLLFGTISEIIILGGLICWLLKF